MKLLAWYKDNISKSIGGYTILNENACVSCNKSCAQMPYKADCGHTFCYFCLQASLHNNSELLCPVCYKQIKGSKRM